MNARQRAIAVQGIGYGVRAVAIQGFGTDAIILPPLTQHDALGAGGAAPQRTSRYSDTDAYKPDRVKSRLEAIVLNGKHFNPLDTDIFDIIEDAAKVQEPDNLPEMQRQDRKLSRTFSVMTDDVVIEIPMYRPMLREIPDFQSASIDEFRAYAQRARDAVNEERKRILLLLCADA